LVSKKEFCKMPSGYELRKGPQGQLYSWPWVVRGGKKVLMVPKGPVSPYAQHLRDLAKVKPRR